jgi:hypothetical protein
MPFRVGRPASTLARFGARHYLLDSSLELNETACLVGYEDANSFCRTMMGRHIAGTLEKNAYGSRLANL